MEDEGLGEKFQTVEFVSSRKKKHSRTRKETVAPAAAAVFVANLDMLLSDLDRDLASGFQSVLFLDIQPALLEPILACSSDLRQCKEDLRCVFSRLAVWSGRQFHRQPRRLLIFAKDASPGQPFNSPNEASEGNLNLQMTCMATVTGWLLGYPAIYFYGTLISPETRESHALGFRQNCLPHVPLNVFSCTLSLSSNLKTSDSEISQAKEPFAFLPLCQFSVPCHLVLEHPNPNSSEALETAEGTAKPKETNPREHPALESPDDGLSAALWDDPLSQFKLRVAARCKASKLVSVRADFQQATVVRDVVPV